MQVSETAFSAYQLFYLRLTDNNRPLHFHTASEEIGLKRED